MGYVATGFKSVREWRIGDTITHAVNGATERLPGYDQVKPMVLAGVYPVDKDDYGEMRDALEKLQLNDASLQYEPEVSQALGFGFRCGFLGLLHMDIVQERLEREFDMDLITTAPTVVYEILMRDGSLLRVENPSKLPNPDKIEEIREPIVDVTIFVPQEYVGNVITLCTKSAASRRILPITVARCT